MIRFNVLGTGTNLHWSKKSGHTALRQVVPPYSVRYHWQSCLWEMLETSALHAFFDVNSSRIIFLYEKDAARQQLWVFSLRCFDPTIRIRSIAVSNLQLPSPLSFSPRHNYILVLMRLPLWLLGLEHSQNLSGQLLIADGNLPIASPAHMQRISLGLTLLNHIYIYIYTIYLNYITNTTHQ